MATRDLNVIFLLTSVKESKDFFDEHGAPERNKSKSTSCDEDRNNNKLKYIHVRPMFKERFAESPRFFGTRQIVLDPIGNQISKSVVSRKECKAL